MTRGLRSRIALINEQREAETANINHFVSCHVLLRSCTGEGIAMRTQADRDRQMILHVRTQINAIMNERCSARSTGTFD